MAPCLPSLVLLPSLLWGTDQDNPITTLILVPAEASASQVASHRQHTPVPLYSMWLYVNVSPSLGCELLQGRDAPESSPVPSARNSTWHNVGAAQQIFVEFPSESNRKSPPSLPVDDPGGDRVP